MEDKRYIKKRYIFINVIMIGLALWLIILPERYSSTEVQADKLLLEINDNTRYLTTDEIAHKIINDDRHLLLIDVRSPEEYNKFHLKGAVNIPLENLLDKDEDGNYVWEETLNQDISTNVFYSNGTIYSSQAWLLTKRLNFKNNYILKGGLNEWFATIISPKQPKTGASETEMAQYQARKGASIYFGGGNSVSNESTPSSNSVLPVVKKKKEGSAGGC